MEIARSTTQIFILRILSSVVGFVGLTVFAREFGASELGIFFLFQAVLAMLAIPANMGLRGATRKRISEGNDQGEFLSSAILLKILVLSLPLTILIIFGEIINGYIGRNLVFFLALAIIIQEFARLSLAVLEAEFSLSTAALLRFTRQVIWVGLGWTLVKSGFGLNAIVYSYIIGYVVIFICGWLKCSTPLGRPSIKRARSLTGYGIYDSFGNISQYGFNWMDIILIGVFLTSTEVGAYETAWRVTIPVVFLSQSLAMTLFPQISQWDASQIQKKIESTVSTALSPSVIFVIPSFFGSLVLSKEILQIVFGSSFETAWLVLIILMGMRFFEGFQIILGSLLKGIDRPDLAARATIAAIISNVVLNIILITQIGIIGAALATAISITINCAIHYYYSNRLLAIAVPSREVIWSIISSVIMATAVYIIKTSIVLDSITDLVVIILSGACVYILILFLFPSLRSKVFNQVRTVI